MASSPSGEPRKWYASLAASATCVALGVRDECFYRLLGEHLSRFPFPASRSLDRPLDHRADVLLFQRLEHEHPAARQERSRQLETGILGGGADQRDDAVLDPRKKRVLLRPVEAVDLVAEQDGTASFVLEPLFRLLNDLAHSGHALGDRGERFEVTVRVVRDQPGERRLARPGRAPEDARPHVATTDQLAQRLSRPEQVLLAEKILQRLRPHASGEGLGGAGEEGGIRHGKGETGNGKRVARKRPPPPTHGSRGPPDAPPSSSQPPAWFVGCWASSA